MLDPEPLVDPTEPLWIPLGDIFENQVVAILLVMCEGRMWDGALYRGILRCAGQGFHVTG